MEHKYSVFLDVCSEAEFEIVVAQIVFEEIREVVWTCSRLTGIVDSANRFFDNGFGELGRDALGGKQARSD